MKIKFFIFFILLFAVSSGCGNTKNNEITFHISKIYNHSGIEAYSKGNIPVAISLLKKTCNSDSFDECFLLSKLHLEGKNLIKDNRTAIAIINSLCLKDHGDSCFYLGQLYEKTANLDKRKSDGFYQRAFSAYFKGCNNDKYDDCKRLGESYLAGFIKDPYQKGLEYLDKACSNGNGSSCSSLGDYFMYKEDNKSVAISYYELSCNQGEPQGCINLLDIYNSSQNEVDKKKISKIISASEKMCKKGATNLCLFLGDMYKNYSNIIKPNKEKSFQYTFLACKYNHPYGCKVTGDLYSIGFGTHQNEGATELYYNKACRLGYDKACSLE